MIPEEGDDLPKALKKKPLCDALGIGKFCGFPQIFIQYVPLCLFLRHFNSSSNCLDRVSLSFRDRFISINVFISLVSGLVRGVDPVAKELLILTGLSLEKLQSVNCLLRGGMDLPTSLGQMSQPMPVPYFEATASSGIGCTGLRKERAHLQVRKNPH